MPDLYQVLTEYADTLPDPESAPSPYWTGPEMDRRDLLHVLGYHRSKDNPLLTAAADQMQRAVGAAARLAWYAPEGPVRHALAAVRADLEEALEKALAERGPRSALWPPKAGDIWQSLSDGFSWHARLVGGGMRLIAAPLCRVPGEGEGEFPEAVWELYGPMVLVSTPTAGEHPFVLAVRDALACVQGPEKGGRYEAALKALEGADPQQREHHERLVLVLEHRGADEDVCWGCARQELSEDEMDDPWTEKPLVGECPTLTIP